MVQLGSGKIIQVTQCQSSRYNILRNTDNMKQFLTILFSPCMFLLQCKGQEPKKNMDRTGNYVSFNEKQGNSTDIIKDEAENNSMAITSSRYAAKKGNTGCSPS